MSQNYGTASQLLNDVGRELSTTNPNPGAIVRKMQYATAQPNNYRANLLDRLDDATGNNIGDLAAGWAFRDPMPRGLSGKLAPFAAGYTAFAHPAALPLGLLTSPRLVGEGASALGSAYRAIPSLPPNVNPWLYGTMGGLLSGGAPQDGGVQ